MVHILSLNLIASTSQIVQNRVSSVWPWYIIRASGFTAVALLIMLTISGIGQVTGLTFKYLEPIKAWAFHKALAYTLCAAVIVHGGFLLLDHYVKFTIPQILIPFVSHYNNKSSLIGLNLGWFGVTAGILASYGIAVIIISSLGWIDTKKKAWKQLHYLSYLVAILVFIHALSTGSDLKYGTFRLFFIFLGLLTIIGVISRIYRAGIIKE
ncbi:MAG: ferric reductase-like transmembrane domain-containing protein [bacterium]